MERQLPNAASFEQSLLGAALIDPQVIPVCEELDLQKTEFFLPAHQKIFAAMQALNKFGTPVDIQTVIQKLSDEGELEAAGGADYIVKLLDSAVSSASARAYVAQIKNKAQIRELIFASEKIGEDAYEGNDDLDSLLDSAERVIMDVTRHRRGTDFQSSEEIVSRVMEDLRNLQAMRGIGCTGISTGYGALDSMTNGFQPGALMILAARPAMGKSAFALNLANNVSRLNSGAVAVFSLEMPADSLMKRLIASEAKVGGMKLQNGNLSEDEMSAIYEAGNRLSDRKIFIDDSSSIKVSQIYSKCRKLKAEYNDIALVVIDYLQLITGRGQESRQQEVSDISRQLKIMAMELNCPVLALSQLSRKVEERTNHEPMLSDLRESGSIEQDADIVMFLFRKAYYEKDEDKEKENREDATEVVDLSLAKHRSGATGQLQLAFQKSYSKFVSLASENDVAGSRF